jgi:hypothetical protein
MPRTERVRQSDGALVRRVFIPKPSQTHPSTKGVTYLPNVWLDHVMGKLTHAQWRVLSVLLREAYGWHHDYFSLSVREIARRAGVNKETACKALQYLAEKNYLKVIEKGRYMGPELDGKSSVYSLFGGRGKWFVIEERKKRPSGVRPIRTSQ